MRGDEQLQLYVATTRQNSEDIEVFKVTCSMVLFNGKLCFTVLLKNYNKKYELVKRDASMVKADQLEPRPAPSENK